MLESCEAIRTVLQPGKTPLHKMYIIQTEENVVKYFSAILFNRFYSHY